MKDIDPPLVAELQTLGSTYGPLGVALAAAELTDPGVLVDRLQDRGPGPVDEDAPERELAGITEEEIDDRFSFHPPASQARRDAHQLVRDLLKATALGLVAITPPGRDQSLMLTHLEDAMMRANRALALSPDPDAPAG